MLARVKSHIFPGPKLYGLEVYDDASGLQYKLLEIKRSKNELTIRSSQHFLEWEPLIATLNKNIPICLVYNTKAVLHKIVPNPNGLTGDVLVEKAYPNLDFSRFYYNSVPFGTHSYIALLARKELDTFLNRFKQNQLPILSVSLGVSDVAHLRPHMRENHLETATKVLHFSEDSPNTLLQVENKTAAIRSNPYQLSGLEVTVLDAIAFATTLGQFQQSNAITVNYGEYHQTQKKEFSYARAYQVLLWPIIAFYILLLLGNSLAFTTYFRAHNTLALAQDTNRSQKNQLIALNERVNTKEKRVQTILSNKNSRSTQYLDEIALHLPTTIVLEQLIFQPLSKPVREAKEIHIDSDQLLVAGETEDAQQFSFWIGDLERLPWASQVETLHFGHLKKDRSDFQIKITIQ